MQERRRALLYGGGSNDSNSLPGEFSVSATKKVRFAKGNLVATITGQISGTDVYTGTWDFAEHQYDAIGTVTNQSFTTGAKLYLFGWVGSDAAYNSYGLCSNYSGETASANYITYYGNIHNTLKTDWGNIPDIIINKGSGYRSLTSAEVTYLLSSRTNATSLRGLGKVGDVPGLILLPDNWSCPTGLSFSAYITAYTNNVYTTTQWSAMENAGAIFLPTGFYRQGYRTYSMQAGYYRLSDSYYMGGTTVYTFMITPNNIGIKDSDKEFGYSVRLVKEV